jgi:hypothetical protein
MLFVRDGVDDQAAITISFARDAVSAAFHREEEIVPARSTRDEGRSVVEDGARLVTARVAREQQRTARSAPKGLETALPNHSVDRSARHNATRQLRFF